MYVMNLVLFRSFSNTYRVLPTNPLNLLAGLPLEDCQHVFERETKRGPRLGRPKPGEGDCGGASES